MSLNQDGFRVSGQPHTSETLALVPESENVCEANRSDSDSSIVLGGRIARRRKAPTGLKSQGRGRHYTPAELLAARTHKTDGCWLALGYANPRNGYVQIGQRPRHYAHRLAWELANGQSIPPGLSVLHSCDNPRCVNPEHLSIGTQADNVLDAVRKGRYTAWRRSGVRLDGRKALCQPVEDASKLLESPQPLASDVVVHAPQCALAQPFSSTPLKGHSTR